MKRYFNIIILLLLVCVSCQERHPALFEDICGVYFRNLSPTMAVVDTTEITFVYESADEVEVPVRIQLLGRSSPQDRKVNLVVSSENAEAGVDYELPQEAYIPAGMSETDYIIKLKRTPDLKVNRKTIELELFENEFFNLPVTVIEQVADTVSTIVYRIHFSDMFMTAPVAWDANLVGEFTQQKFELICSVLDVDPADFNDQSKVTLAKLLYISTEMTYYVREQERNKKNGLEYDQRAFDQRTGQPLLFTKSV